MSRTIVKYRQTSFVNKAVLGITRTGSTTTSWSTTAKRLRRCSGRSPRWPHSAFTDTNGNLRASARAKLPLTRKSVAGRRRLRSLACSAHITDVCKSSLTHIPCRPSNTNHVTIKQTPAWSVLPFSMWQTSKKAYVVLSYWPIACVNMLAATLLEFRINLDCPRLFFQTGLSDAHENWHNISRQKHGMHGRRTRSRCEHFGKHGHTGWTMRSNLP